MNTVSIIIPCYNDGKYLPEALAAAQAQTHLEREIIVVDDHSTDEETQSVLRQAAEQGVRVIQTPAGKKGPSAARNAGIALARGEFILPLDADDRIAPEYAEKALRCMRDNPALGICYCKARLFGLKRGAWRLPPYSREGLLSGNMIFATAMFRKSDWEALGGYDESLVDGLEDYAFWLRLVALGRGVAQIDEELFYYRVKPRSRTARIVEEDREAKVLKDVYRSCESIFRDNADILFLTIQRMQKERGERTCLFSWKLLAPLLKCEWYVRQKVKRLLGRA